MIRICWRDYIAHLALESLGILQEELENIAEERDIWTTLLDCCHRQLATDKWDEL